MEQNLTPSISVIMPSLNVAHYIDECLSSVINQSLKNIEIICVDAGSTDGTLEKIKNYAEKDERIKVIVSEKKSYGYQMNLGLKMAKGKYIGIVETDDYININMYEELFNTAEKYNLDFVKADFYRFINNDNSELELFYNKLSQNKSYYNRVITPRVALETFSFIMNTWSGIYKNDFLKKYNIDHNETPGAAFQDTGFWFQTFSFADRAYFIDKPFYMNRRDNPNSSVFDRKKIFAAQSEYNYIYSKLQNFPQIKQAVLPAFQYYRYKHYCASMNRSDESLQLEFLKHFSQDYIISKNKNELDESLFPEGAKNNLHSIIESPENYYHTLNNIPKKNLYNTENMYHRHKLHKGSSYALSVIIAVYNAEKTIQKCINSILRQTLKQIEIICIDDGSIDQSFNILKKLEKEYDQIIIRSQQNQGAGSARNKAIELAQGEFIAFMDADDWYPEDDILETLYNKAKENNANICGGSFSYQKNGVVHKNYSGIFKLYTFTKEKFIDYKDYQFDYGYTRFIYNLQMLKKHNITFPEIRRFQDPPFFVRAMITAGKFYAIPKIVYLYNKENNKVNWTAQTVHDLLHGIIENLELSKEYHLPTLHRITVEHLNVDFKKIITGFLTKDNPDLLELVCKANNTISSDLLLEAGYDININKKYVIKCIKELFMDDENKKISLTITGQHGKHIYTNFTEVKISESHDADKILVRENFPLKNKIQKIKSSFSYKIGRAITFIPRLVNRKLNNKNR